MSESEPVADRRIGVSRFDAADEPLVSVAAIRKGGYGDRTWLRALLLSPLRPMSWNDIGIRVIDFIIGLNL